MFEIPDQTRLILNSSLQERQMKFKYLPCHCNIISCSHLVSDSIQSGHIGAHYTDTRSSLGYLYLYLVFGIYVCLKNLLICITKQARKTFFVSHDYIKQDLKQHTVHIKMPAGSTMVFKTKANIGFFVDVL